MGIVVDIGFERFGYGQTGPERVRFVERALQILVAEDYTTRVRDFVDNDVIEVSRVDGRVLTTWASSDAKREMAEAYAAVGGSWDFAYWQLDELGVDNVQTLAIVRDGANTSRTVVLPGGRPETLIDLDCSLRTNWVGLRNPKARGAAKLHRFAKKYRMVIHSE